MNNLDLNTILIAGAVLAVGFYLWRKHQAANAPPPADWFLPPAPAAPASPPGPVSVVLHTPGPDVGLKVIRSIKEAQEIGEARRIEAAMQNGPPSAEVVSFANTLLGAARALPRRRPGRGGKLIHPTAPVAVGVYLRKTPKWE